MRSLAAEKAAEQAWSYSIRAVESFHMVKLGNNIKILSFARVANRPGLVAEYERIIANYRNPLFRSALMRALIRGEPWYRGMIELFAEYPWPFFVEGEKTPRFLPRFGRDAKDQLRSIQEDRRAQLAVMIQRLINAYVAKRAEAKTGIKVDGISKTPVKTKQGTTRMLRVYPKEFREAQQKVCTDAFLAIRSRHDQDFVEYFAGSICSAAQYLSKSDYQLLIQTLMTKSEQSPLAEKKTSWEDIKAIAMIALSSCAFNVRPRETESQGSK